MATAQKPTVAIVGSGISGLTAAYFLKEKYEVCLVERSASLGMGAHGVQVNGAVVDVPLRFFDYHYYPNLIKLYIAAGVQFSSRSYSFSAVDFLTQRLLWRCHSVRSKNLGTSRLALDLWTMAKHCFRSIRVFFEISRFKRDMLTEDVSAVTLGQFLKRHKYSDDFVYLVLVPFLAVTCTCSYDEVLNMPMDVVADYYSSNSDYNLQRFRIDGCTNDACTKLSEGCEVLLKVEVLSVRPIDSKVEIRYREVSEPSGAILTRMFDQVVIAVEAPFVPPLLLTGNEASDREVEETFACFKYAKTRVITHTDSTLMPRERRHWSLLNFLLDGQKGQMTSVPMNDLIPALGTTNAAVFQTWNPLKLPDPSKILADSTFLRALVTSDSARGVQKLQALQGKNNIYYVGAYSLYSFTLLENGCRSTMQVVARMGCTSNLLCRCSSMTCACPRALPSVVQENDRQKGELGQSRWSVPGVSLVFLATVALLQRIRFPVSDNLSL